MGLNTNIVLTGATGFVGRALLAKLLENGEFNVTAALRNKRGFSASPAIILGDFSKSTNWFAAVNNQRVVIHTTARNQVIKDKVADALEELSVNVSALIKTKSYDGTNTNISFKTRSDFLKFPRLGYALW